MAVVLEFLFFFVVGGSIAAAPFLLDGIGARLPIPAIFFFLVFVYLLFVVWSLAFSSVMRRVRFAAWFSLMAFVVYRFPWHPDLLDPWMIGFYYVTLFLVGSGARRAGCSLAGLSTIGVAEGVHFGVYAWYFATHFGTTFFQATARDGGRVPEILIHAIGLTAAGIIPVLLKGGPPPRRPVPPPAPPTDGARSAETVSAAVSGIDREETVTMTRSAPVGSVEGILESVVYFMVKNFRAYSALGFIADSEKQQLVLNSFHSRSTGIIKNTVIPLGAGVLGESAVKKRSFMSGDITLYNHKLPYYSEHELINSVCAMPIISEKGELLGMLVLDSKDKNTFSDSDKENLRRFSLFAAALITNVRMRMAIENQSRQFQMFYNASQHFIKSLRPNEVFDVLLAMAAEAVPVDRAIAVSFDGTRRCGCISRVT